MDYNEFEYRSKRSQLSFMYDTISMNENQIRAWLRIPEFVFKIHDLMDQGFEIKNDLIFDIAVPILLKFKEQSVSRTLDPEIRLKSLKGGVNQLIKATGKNGGKNVGSSWQRLQDSVRCSESVNQ